MKTLLTFLLFSVAIFAQEKYLINPKFKDFPKAQLVAHADSTFYFQAQIGFNVTMDLIKPLKEIKVDKSSQTEYLNEQLVKIDKDPSDFVAYGNAAHYYKNVGREAQAKEFYEKAYSKLKLLPKAKDSAFFYSYRGLLKANLGKDGAPDMERALAINKADSLALLFYPMVLIQQQKFPEVKKILLNAIPDKTFGEYSYFMLLMADLYEELSKFPSNGNGMFDGIKAMNLAEVTKDKYSDKINTKAQNLDRFKQMVDLLYMLLKFGAAADNKEIVLQPNDYELLASKEKYLKAWVWDKKNNAYGGNSALGLVHFLQQKYDLALAGYQNAIKAFPADKESVKFNLGEVYGNIAAVYFRQKKNDKIVESFAKKLSIKSLNVSERQQTYVILSKLEFQRGNLEKSTDYARDALAISPDFDAYFLLSHLYFKTEANSLSDLYREKAQASIPMDRLCEFLEYFSALQLMGGQFDGAYINFEDFVKRSGFPCDDCKKLLETYLVAK